MKDVQKGQFQTGAGHAAMAAAIEALGRSGTFSSNNLEEHRRKARSGKLRRAPRENARREY